MATPTVEDSGISYLEQSDTPRENLAPVQPESSAETSGKSQQNSSLVEDDDEEILRWKGLARVLIPSQGQCQSLKLTWSWNHFLGR